MAILKKQSSLSSANHGTFYAYTDTRNNLRIIIYGSGLYRMIGNKKMRVTANKRVYFDRIDDVLLAR